jgi:hypothetical protein
MNRKEQVKLDRDVIIKTFPTLEGDTQEHIKFSVLTKEKVFAPNMPHRVVINCRFVDTWNELLNEAQRTPADKPIKIIKFMPVMGG